MANRVQWFWHFFRDSICFMCFWFGLEILRLVYKKYWTVSILYDLLSSEKSSAAPYKSWKKFLRNWAYRVSKEAEFCSDFKSVQKSWVWQKRKIFLQKNWILRDLENLAKNCFSWCKSSTHFLNQHKIPLLLIPFAPNFEEIFFQLI